MSIQEHTVDDEDSGQRIDVLLKTLEPDYSRNTLQQLLKSGLATVNDNAAAADYRVCPGDRIRYETPEKTDSPKAEDIPLSIIHEDRSILVINKTQDLTVHPVRAKHDGTLVNALMAHTESLSDIGGPLRRGIVHRLDRDTSGVMVVTKTNEAHIDLARQFKTRKVKKQYTAIVEGSLELDADRVRLLQSRHEKHPQRMSSSAEGKEAQTEYEVVERFDRYTLVLARPRTGRTHQIRLMFSQLGRPIACDSMYGARKPLAEKDMFRRSDNPDRIVIQRQALHSSRLEFIHPQSGAAVSFSAPLPRDMEDMLSLLRKNS